MADFYENEMLIVTQYSGRLGLGYATIYCREYHEDWAAGFDDAVARLYIDGAAGAKQRCNESVWVVPGTWFEAA